MHSTVSDFIIQMQISFLLNSHFLISWFSFCVLFLKWSWKWHHSNSPGGYTLISGCPCIYFIGRSCYKNKHNKTAQPFAGSINSGDEVAGAVLTQNWRTLASTSTFPYENYGEHLQWALCDGKTPSGNAPDTCVLWAFQLGPGLQKFKVSSKNKEASN